MGKAKRSKNKRNNKSKQSKQGGGPTSIPDGVNLPSSTEGSAGILGRIRHGDPRVRLGALTALSATILDADNLIAASSNEGSSASASKRKQISDGLLKAISERVMDGDSSVAINAAGCVSNYATFSADVEEGNIGIATGASGTTRNPAVLGGVGEVLLARIAQCQADIARIGQELAQLSSQQASSGGDNNNNIKAAGNAANKVEKTMRKLEEQWTLAHLCLDGVAALVERSPMALERFGGAGHHANLIGATVGIISLAGQSTASAAGIDEATTKTVFDGATSAARCIHSALDENPALLQSLLNANSSDAAASAGITAPPLQVLLSAVNAGSMPALARLHSAGAIITARHLLPRTIVGDESTSTTDLQSKLNEMDGMLSAHVLPLLAQYLQYQPTIATALIARISATKSERDAEVEDAKIEREVEKAIDDRKESARSIARRQKAIKDEKKAAEQAAREAAAQGSAAAMMEDGASGTNASGAPGGTAASSMAGDGDQQDESNVVESAEDLYDKAVEAWRSSCLPLKLAVEVAANLCAGSGTSSNGGAQDGDEEDEMMWDSDDDDNLVVDSSENGAGVDKEAHERDEKLFGEVIRLDIPNRVVDIVRNIASTHSADVSMPEVAVDDLVELLSKCGVCGANAAGNLHTWAAKADESAQLWNVLCGVVRSSPSHSISNELIVAGKGAAVAIILALLRNRQGLISSVGEEDLNAVLALLGIENGGENCTDARRDCIALLGILCSEPHPPAVNATIVDAFLTILAREDEEIGVISEILNSIIDMYALDETDEGNHEATFRQKNVLAALQAVLPNFKKRVTLERGKADADSIELWKETHLNCKRFIQYKNGIK